MYQVYGKDGCGFCTKAVEVLESVGEKYVYLKLGTDYRREDLQEKTGQDSLTYPRIFLGEELVGGYDELLDKLI